MPPSISESDVTVAVFPDTQYYCSQNNGIFEQMTQWLVDNRSTYNIEMVLHEGDIIDGYDSATAEWDVAEAALDKLDTDNLPALLATGNHDAAQDDPRSLPTFRSRFPTTRYDSLKSEGEIDDFGTYDGNPENAYLTQTHNGQKFLYLAIEFGPRDVVVDWADTVLSNHPDSVALFVTHSYLWVDGTRVTSEDPYAPSEYGLTDSNNGSDLWEKLLVNHDNVAATFSGHHINTPPNVNRSEDYSVNGVGVSQQFVNYQQLSNGGDGWMRLLTIDTDTLETQVTTYSPHLSSWGADASQQWSTKLLSNRLSGRKRTVI